MLPIDLLSWIRPFHPGLPTITAKVPDRGILVANTSHSRVGCRYRDDRLEALPLAWKQSSPSARTTPRTWKSSTGRPATAQATQQPGIQLGPWPNNSNPPEAAQKHMLRTSNCRLYPIPLRSHLPVWVAPRYKATLDHRRANFLSVRRLLMGQSRKDASLGARTVCLSRVDPTLVPLTVCQRPRAPSSLRPLVSISPNRLSPPHLLGSVRDHSPIGRVSLLPMVYLPCPTM